MNSLFSTIGKFHMSNYSNDIGPGPQKIATAFHESGHAIMAISLGRLIEKVTIEPKKNGIDGIRLGSCKLQKGRSKASKDWLEDEVMILLGGMVAESFVTGRYCEMGAASDLSAVRRLLQSQPGSPKQLERWERRMLDRTVHWLNAPSHRETIEVVAKELLEKTTVSGRAVRHFLALAEAKNGDGGR